MPSGIKLLTQSRFTWPLVRLTQLDLAWERSTVVSSQHRSESTGSPAWGLGVVVCRSPAGHVASHRRRRCLSFTRWPLGVSPFSRSPLTQSLRSQGLPAPQVFKADSTSWLPELRLCDHARHLNGVALPVIRDKECHSSHTRNVEFFNAPLHLW